jgi:hypothetical protein
MNSREKGKRGERAWRDELRAHGFDARRGQQFCGSPDSPDVVCPDLAWIHFEVKHVQRLNINDAMDQARRDGADKVPVVAHRRSFCPWLVTMEAETFFRLLRGDFLTEGNPDRSGRSALGDGGGTDGKHGTDRRHGAERTDSQSPIADSQFEISDFNGPGGPARAVTTTRNERVS